MTTPSDGAYPASVTLAPDISGVADTPASVLRRFLNYGYQLALRWQWVLCMLAGAIGIHIMETMYRLKIFDSYWSLEAILTIEPFRLVAGVSFFGVSGVPHHS